MKLNSSLIRSHVSAMPILSSQEVKARRARRACWGVLLGSRALRSGRRAVLSGLVGPGRRPRRPRRAAEVRGRAGADDVDGGGGVRPGRVLPHRVPLLPLCHIGVSI